MSEEAQPIIGGTATTEATYPSSLAYRAQDASGAYHICTGTLIAPTEVLTAAHCFYTQGPMPNPSITFEVNSQSTSAVTYPVIGWSIHPQYVHGLSSTWKYDLAIIHLGSAPAKPVQLLATPAISAGLALNQLVPFVGWGKTNWMGQVNPANDPSGIKFLANGKIDALSSDFITFKAPDLFLPPNSVYGGLCYGDSGGPTFVNVGGTPYQIGVHSHALFESPTSNMYPCANRSEDVRLTDRLMWIHQQVLLGCSSGLPCSQRCGDYRCDAAYENASSCAVDCAPTCGDGVCRGSETNSSCPGDCHCGDQVCGSGETPTSCPGDCPGSCGDGTCTTVEGSWGCGPDCCGNGVCSAIEQTLGGYCEADCCGDGSCSGDEPTYRMCLADCGVGCGDNVCDAGYPWYEDTGWCPQDCCGDGVCGMFETGCGLDCGGGNDTCGDGVCSPGEDELNCAYDCHDGFCGDEVCNNGEDDNTCHYDCGPYCGNGLCNGNETQQTCPLDCGSPPPVCGDGSCTGNETQESCSKDCGKPSCRGSRYYAKTNTMNGVDNFATVNIILSAGQTLDFGTCGVAGSSASGDTYVRLYFNGFLQMVNDDACSSLASRMTFTATSTGNHVIQLGCYDVGSCEATATWTITGGACGGGPVELGRISYWWGKVNVHKAPGGAWTGDSDCTSGADLNPLTYCRKFWPATSSVTSVAVTPKTGNIWWTATCGQAYASNGQNEYICNQ